MAPNLRIARLDEAPSEDERDLLSEYIAARRAFDQAERHLKKIQNELAEDMAENHRKSFTLTDHEEHKVHTVTFVQAERVELDEKGLRKALTAKVFDKSTVKKLDKKALEEAMSRGDIDPMLVSKYVSAAKGLPYLRYTEKDATDE
jgi:hypothetical protein